jgi:hypothetical protein
VSSRPLRPPASSSARTARTAPHRNIAGWAQNAYGGGARAPDRRGGAARRSEARRHRASRRCCPRRVRTGHVAAWGRRSERVDDRPPGYHTSRALLGLPAERDLGRPQAARRGTRRHEKRTADPDPSPRATRARQESEIGSGAWTSRLLRRCARQVHARCAVRDAVARGPLHVLHPSASKQRHVATARSTVRRFAPRPKGSPSRAL